mmetsp:Transcript_5490/g.20575  ORF Transcript_5490/g.20575 Transcript_5490/m.20575 type:complete len:363 (-) Transcript_5490:100-1188(-)
MSDSDQQTISYQKSIMPKKVNQYLIGETLGIGAYGKVKECIDSRSLKRVAIKIIKFRKLKRIKNSEERLKNEINIMKRLNHLNTLHFYEVIHDEENQKLYLVIEFCGAGSLEDILQQYWKNNQRMPENEIWFYFRQAVAGVQYLHDQGIIHRDIKPANMMITPDRVLKISDYGVSSELDRYTQSDTCTKFLGTPAFQSPEVAQGSKEFSGFSLDVWALGVTLYIMACGKYPFNAEGFEVFDKIKEGTYEKIPSRVSKSLTSLIEGIMCKDVEHRFTMQQVLEHEWMRNTQKTDFKPLVDRWKSFSLLSYIKKAVAKEHPEMGMVLNPSFEEEDVRTSPSSRRSMDSKMFPSFQSVDKSCVVS